MPANSERAVESELVTEVRCITGDISTGSSSKKKRLNLDLTPTAFELLQELAEDSGRNMADVLRTGLALYGIAQEEAKKGRYLAIAEGERVVREIILP